MRKRVYWLLPDVASAARVMDDLLLARIEVGHVHFMAREDIALADLPAANVLQTSDIVRSAQLGLMVGGLLGAVAGLAIGFGFPIVAEGMPQLGVFVTLAALGALFGAWASSMIGASIPSHRLGRFHAAIAQGHVLLMVDVPRGRVIEVEERLHARHPEAHLEGLEPNIPAFP